MTGSNQKNESEVEKTVISLFKNACRRWPKEVAIRSSEKWLSYEDLYAQVVEFSKYVRTFQDKFENYPVAVCVEDACLLALAMLGTFMAKGIYLPINFNFPANRINFILSDAKPRFIITQSKFKDLFIDSEAEIFLIDKWVEDFKFQTSQKKSETILTYVESETPAYIIYTSGSTGRPKGVVVGHKGLTNLLLSRQKFYTGRLLTLYIGSLSFDVSIMTILQTLISGGTLFLESNIRGLDVDFIWDLIKKEKINFIGTVPSLYEIFLNKNRNINSLEYVVLGGESMPASLPKRHKAVLPKVSLYNEYGPTECTVCVSIAKIYCPSNKKIEKITIGKAISHVQIYILDRDKKIVPTGTKGEIYIGGVALAIGYLNNESLTKEKFVKLSLGGKQSPKVRLYRTGDYGRVLPDGNVDFLGRADEQVNINGLRIELGEIEHVLYQHPEITGCLIIKDTSGQNAKLIGYYSTRGQISNTEVYDHLTKNLPSYMIPSRMIEVEKFELSASGKICRDKIPLPIKSQHQQIQQSVSSHEDTILKIWKKLLKSEHIGICDKFFEVGGDSLMVPKVHQAIKEAFCLDFPITKLFHFSTVKEIASYIESIELASSDNFLGTDEVLTKRSIRPFLSNNLRRRRIRRRANSASN